MSSIFKLVFADILKNRIVAVYTLLLAALSWSMFALEDNSSKGLLSLMNIILLVVPLVSVIFSTIYNYNNAEFIELLLSQPISRKLIWRNLFFGLSASLMLAFFVGAGIPLLIFTPLALACTMILTGMILTMVFAALAFLSCSISRDKAKGIGITIVLWLFYSVLFDGLVLFLTFQFADYPIEKMMIGVSLLNPVDTARILILLQLDVSALMGYTGAVFREFFGTMGGIVISVCTMLMWVWLPYYISLRRFSKKDL